MADYRLTDSADVVRLADNAVIPNDPNNRDRMEYDEWLTAGGVPDPYVPPSGEPFIDANARIDAGVNAALTAATDVRDNIHAISPTMNAANFQQFLLQAKMLSDAFVAMLQAQSETE